MSEWTTICDHNSLINNTGICAKYNDQQVAIFYCKRSENVYAVSNFDPIGKAQVMSRGIMGSTKGETYVASPLYKQRYNLSTGVCLDDASQTLTTFDVRIADNEVQLKKAS
jgi:nitrite reductase (NADH) small subunit